MMTASEVHIHTAQQLLEQECARSDGDVAAAAAYIFEQLFDALAPVIGSAAVIALLARSLKAVTVEHPCLSGVAPDAKQAGHPQAVQQIRGALGDLPPATARAASCALLGELLRLMSTFIGERVTWQIMKKAFTELERVPAMETE